MSARIVFDLDGTLIDSSPDICAIAADLLWAEGLAPLTLDETRGFVGAGAAVFVARMRAARGLPDATQDRLLAAFLARYEDAVTLTRPYPGVAEALPRLGAAGDRLGICTNKPERPARAVLRHLGLAPHFPVLVGGDSLPLRKPDPAPLVAALAGLGDGPCLFVGDSGIDAETARRAGVPFALFTEGYRADPVAALPHAAAFADFTALPGIVAAILPDAGKAQRD
jgi:phosphoglycolate phosphatase